MGLAEDAFIVASEPYGVVEETDTYIRMDGETPSDPTNPTGSRGQIIELRGDRAGELGGHRLVVLRRNRADATADDLITAQITTRDIDRGTFPHFLLKEITDAPASFRKTLRGKLISHDDHIEVAIGPKHDPRRRRRSAAGRLHPAGARDRPGHGGHRRPEPGPAPHRVSWPTPHVSVDALPATELSGFQMRADMSDTLAVAISQSGTTTDTNRTVDLIRGRGASVIAIVNRRGSDLTDKADGVLYTSDGRDVEMSVASTKAFYAQVAAGLLLAYAIADVVPGARHSSHRRGAGTARGASRDPGPVAGDARDPTGHRRRRPGRSHPSRRYWAIVGNGTNQIAAREMRIKLSELCYKAIACDATEDKKHIDLSSEPMILVCAAGLFGSTADDVAKEVAIFRAHKAAPIVIASEGGRAFTAALAVLSVPDTHPRLGFILATMVGHLFGYEAALAIDAQARPMREARAAIDVAITDRGGDPLNDRASGESLLRRLRPTLATHSATFFDGVRSGALQRPSRDEHGGAPRRPVPVRHRHQPARRLSVGVRQGRNPGGGSRRPHRRASAPRSTSSPARSTPSSTRPRRSRWGSPGATSRSCTCRWWPACSKRGRPATASPTRPSSRSGSSIRAWPRSSGRPGTRSITATIWTGRRSSSSIGSACRPACRRGSTAIRDCAGTKALVAREQELMVARGRSDGRLVVIVPETKDGTTTGLQLLHVRLADRLPAGTARAVLQGYRRRYQALKDAVTETEDVFRDDLLAQQPVADLLTVPILDLADRWRS